MVENILSKELARNCVYEYKINPTSMSKLNVVNQYKNLVTLVVRSKIGY